MKFISFLTSLLFITSALGSYTAPEKDDLKDNRKTFYLHVGPHKTGSKSIQDVADKNRGLLGKHGCYYPPCPPVKGSLPVVTRHLDIWAKIKSGKLQEVFDNLKQIESDAKKYSSIFLSAEEFSVCHNDDTYLKFLDQLDKQFKLKILYCVRDIADRITSATNNSACRIPLDLSCWESLQTYVGSHVLSEFAMINFYASRGAKFLFFENLVATGNFVAAFMEEGLGFKRENLYRSKRGKQSNIPKKHRKSGKNMFPNIHENDKYSYFSLRPKLGREQLHKLEDFFMVERGSFFEMYTNPYDGGKKFCDLIVRITRSASKNYTNALMQSVPQDFETLTYVSQFPDIPKLMADGSPYPSKVLDVLARIDYLFRGHAQGLLTVCLPACFEPLKYIRLNSDLEKHVQGKNESEKITFALEHFFKFGWSKGRMFVPVPPSFRPLQYIEINEDLANYARNMTQAQKIAFAQDHYFKMGAQAGRMY
jgi:hypothetical protein